MSALPFTVNDLCKAEMEYHGKFGHTLGWIHQIDIMIRIDIFYTSCNLVTQTVAPTITGFQGLKICIQYISSHPHKPIFYPYTYYDGSNIIRIAWSVNKVKEYTTQNCP